MKLLYMCINKHVGGEQIRNMWIFCGHLWSNIGGGDSNWQFNTIFKNVILTNLHENVLYVYHV